MLKTFQSYGRKITYMVPKADVILRGKYLGLCFEQELTMEKQGNYVCSPPIW
jgi:hypothetical protein